MIPLPEKQTYLPPQEAMQVPQTQPAPTSMLEVIARVASDPNADVDKLERLLAMKERVDRQAAEAAFNEAMNKAQSEMGRISTDAENTQTRSKYASYGAMDRALRPIYTRHGFSLSFSQSDDIHVDGYARFICIVGRGGFSRTYQIDVPNDGKGAKGNDVMTKTHAQGAASSYAMRYLLKMIFNVALGEDDRDGNQPEDTITHDQAADLYALCEEVGADKAGFCRYLKVENLSDLPVRKFRAAVQALENKRK